MTLKTIDTEAILDSDQRSPMIPALKTDGSRRNDISARRVAAVHSLTPLDTRIGKKWTVTADFMIRRSPIDSAMSQ